MFVGNSHSYICKYLVEIVNNNASLHCSVNLTFYYLKFTNFVVPFTVKSIPEQNFVENTWDQVEEMI